MAEKNPTNLHHNTGDRREAKPVSSLPEQSLVDELLGAVRWCGQNPLATLVLAAIAATVVYFYGIIRPFMNHTQSAAAWTQKAWNSENELTHGALIPLASLFLIWYHRNDLRRAAKGGSNLGLIPLVTGFLFFLLSIRCVQPRLAIASMPFLIFGSVMFVWGKAAARTLLFPCAFLVFMMPLAALNQATFRLQFIVTWLIGLLSPLVGISIRAIGTTLTATNGAFNFEVAGGCSGIRSLMAMAMITAVYVHLNHDRLWQKIAIFLASILFAIIGNTGRIFSVVLIARYYDPQFAAGLFHDWSDVIFFPIALMAMLSFSKFVELDFLKLIHKPARKSQEAEKKPLSL